MTLGFVLIVVGLVISVGGVAYALYNMASLTDGRDHSFKDFFGAHLGAMAIMAIGGLIGSIGLVMVVWMFVQKVLPT